MRKHINSLHKWSDIKILQSYRAINPWCQLILKKLNPNFQKGEHWDIALLFLMKLLFRKHVANFLRQEIKIPWQLKTQVSNRYMLNNEICDQKGVKARF